MKKILLAVAGLILLTSPAYAIDQALVVQTCGTQSITPTTVNGLYMDATGNLCTNASGASGVNATIVGPLGTQALANSVAVTAALNTYVDGAIATLGTEADAAWSGSGSGTLIAIQKKMDADINSPVPAGTNLIGKVGIDQTTPGTTNAVQEIPGTAGGLSVSTFEPAASDNHTNLKNGAGQVYWITAFNNSATINYIRFYNAATGFNGCNSATNLVATLHIPANTSDAGFVTSIPTGLPFSTGISYCVVSAYGQTTTTNATATAMDITIGYK